MISYHFDEPYDLRATLECGQNFLFTTSDGGKTYYGPLEDRYIRIKQMEDGHTLQIVSNVESGLKSQLDHFLRIHDPYRKIQQAVAIDPIMQEVIQVTDGLHLLHQPKFECIIGFFLSQCSNIPLIKRNMFRLCTDFGTKIDFDGHDFYLFPTREQLLPVSLEQLRELKFGYRADYIHGFVQNIPGCLESNNISQDSVTFNCALQTVTGIGPKVADCIQLFGFGDLTVFPVDVWIQRFIAQYYFPSQKVTPKMVRQKGQALFGPWAGYAETFIYRYIRLQPKTPRPKKTPKK